MASGQLRPEFQVLKRILLSATNTLLTSFVFAIIVGLILQNATDTTTVRNDTLKLLNRAAFVARAGYDPQISWHEQQIRTTNTEMTTFLYDLDGRLPDDVMACIFALIEDAKVAGAEDVIDASLAISLFEVRRNAIKNALDCWRSAQVYRFGMFRTRMEC